MSGARISSSPPPDSLPSLAKSSGSSAGSRASIWQSDRDWQTPPPPATEAVGAAGGGGDDEVVN